MASHAEKLHIAILDDYNKLSSPYVSSLQAQVTIDVYTDTILPTPSPRLLIARLEKYHVISTMRERTPLPRSVLEGLPKLKIILTTGMHNRGIDLDYCKERGIAVFGTPSGSSPSGTPKGFTATCQHTIALILALSCNIPRDHALVPAGEWIKHNPTNFFLGGATLGLLGLGKLGSATGKIAKQAFGMKIIAWSSQIDQEKANQAALDVGLQPGDFIAVSKEDLLSSSDVLSVHLVLSDRTRGIIGASDLKLMKADSMIVNTSRGPIIDESALLSTLERGAVRGAALDVFDLEPLPADSRWRTTRWGEDGRSQVVFTPHTGYSYDESLSSMWKATGKNMERIVKGEELHGRMV